MNKKAIVLLSGGIDSAVCLALAIEQGYQCYALSIDYQQRHICELRYASKIATQLGAVQHRICTLAIGGWGGSSLTDLGISMPNVIVADNEIPNTYVPARNTIFLATALGWAEAVGAQTLFFGANKTDYDHYPDCRPEYFAAFTQMAKLATKEGVQGALLTIQTPLIEMNKVQIIREGLRLKVDFDLTFSCYDPDSREEPCGKCIPCQLRKEALQEVQELKIS